MTQTKWIQSGDSITPETLEKRLKAVTHELRKKGNKGNLLAQALFQTTKIAETRAKELVPVKTGRLRNAIKKSKDRNPQYDGATEMYNVKVNRGRKRNDERGAWYWTFVHFGTVKQRGVPFLTNAFEQTKQPMAEEFKKQLFRKIELAEKRVKRIK